MKIYSTFQWNAKKPQKWAKKTTAKFIVIHHTATSPSSKGTLEGGFKLARGIQSYHMNNFGFDDSGHNFLNTTSGIILEGRHGSLDALKLGKSVLSAHSGNYEANASPGIENEGIYTIETMPKKQMESLILLCAHLCRELNISPKMIKGHRDFKETLCPGDMLYSMIPNIRSEVAKVLELS